MNSSTKDSTSPVNEILPPKQMFFLGLQHMAVAYVGCIAVPLVIASGLGLSEAETVVLICKMLFYNGIAKLLQIMCFGGVGVRLQILHGVPFCVVVLVVVL